MSCPVDQDIPTMGKSQMYDTAPMDLGDQARQLRERRLPYLPAQRLGERPPVDAINDEPPRVKAPERRDSGHVQKRKVTASFSPDGVGNQEPSNEPRLLPEVLDDDRPAVETSRENICIPALPLLFKRHVADAAGN